jgi:hypothetical protein
MAVILQRGCRRGGLEVTTTVHGNRDRNNSGMEPKNTTMKTMHLTLYIADIAIRTSF